MKILKIAFENIEVFDEKFEVDFIARDKVVNKEDVHNYHSKYYTQNVLALIGMNASGKTSALYLIKMAFDILFKQDPLMKLEIPEGLIKGQTKMTIDFFTEEDKRYYRLESKFEKRDNSDDFEKGFKFKYSEEKLYRKLGSKVNSKHKTTNFEESDVILTREGLMKEISFLREDDSILFYSEVRETREKNKRNCTSMIFENNSNYYRVSGKAKMEDINIFDSSIESLLTDETQIKVKFKNREKEQSCSLIPNINYLLSSGTAKGGNILFMVRKVLRTGGYLIIDELENHFHKRLVQLIIDLFNDGDMNKLGATLIFTTHYAEVLDSIERKDNIFLFIRNKSYKSNIVRYSDMVKRVENKKSEVFLSNYIRGTAPSYSAIQKFKESVWN